MNIEEEEDSICLSRRLKLLAKLGETPGEYGRELIESLNGFQQIETLPVQNKSEEVQLIQKAVMTLFKI